MLSQNTKINLPLEKGWTLVNNKCHPLAKLQCKRLGSYSIVLLIGPKNKFGFIYFKIYLKNSVGDTRRNPVVIGLYNQGDYPSYNWNDKIIIKIKHNNDKTRGKVIW